MKITIPCIPIAKGRPRTAINRGIVWNYTPKKTRDYEELLTSYFLKYKSKSLLTCPINLSVTFYMPIPKNWSKCKRKLAGQGFIRHTTKPDLSNLIKSVEDAGNKIIWQDDSQIIKESISKRYSDNPRIEIYIQKEDAE